MTMKTRSCAMKTKSAALLAALLFLAPAVAGANEKEGWISLFNGKDLSGWKLKQEGGPNGWKVQDGVYVNTPRSTDILTERQFTDFHLHVEFMIPQGSNSGVYLRGRHEMQIFDSFGKTALRPSDCGAVYGVALPATNASKAPDQWQTFDITLVGQRLTVFHNGVCIHNNRDLGTPAEPGPILLQGDHGKVSFRNVKIKPLSPDYASRAKLYVLSQLGDDVYVIDIPSHKVLKRLVLGGNYPGIAANAAQNRVFISATKEKHDTVYVLDPATDEVVQKIPVGPYPDELEVTPDGRWLYVPCSPAGNYAAVDVASGQIVQRIQTGGHPHNVVGSADGQHMFLSPVGEPRKIFVAETATHQVVSTIPLEADARPITLRRDKKRLYIQRNQLLGFELADVSDVKHPRILHTVRLELTPEQQKLPIRDVPSHGLALTPDDKELWFSNINHDAIFVFDATVEPPKQLLQFPTKRDPHWLCFSPDGKYCYISNSGVDELQIVEVASRQEVGRRKVGISPRRLLAVTVAQF
jgi:YVTN family beta-propeller protein